MTTTNQLRLRLGQEVDLVELFFEALARPHNTIVTELLSNGNGQIGHFGTVGFDNDPEI